MEVSSIGNPPFDMRNYSIPKRTDRNGGGDQRDPPNGMSGFPE
jgi:hypothetical protein